MSDFSVWALERLVNSLIGGIAIYLGYRLFRNAPRAQDSRAEGAARIHGPGNISIYVTRIGPGVFFALFGASVLVVSLYKGVSYHGPSDWSGLSGAVSSTDSSRLTHDQLLSARKSSAQDIAALNQVIPALQPGLDPGQRANIELAIPRIKLALMKRVWDTDWGNEAAFSEWVRQGAAGPPPIELEKADEFFNSGTTSAAK